MKPTGPVVIWKGNTRWYIIEAIMSSNGQRYFTDQCNFTLWFSQNAFGGANYADTPVGAVSHTDEPSLPGVNDPAIYFGLWASEKNFAMCAWNSRKIPHFQAVGDPFVTR